MIEGGKTPVLPKQHLADLGFQLILYPLTALFASARLIESVYRTLKEEGTTGRESERLMNFTEFNALIGVDEKIAPTERFGSEAREK